MLYSLFNLFHPDRSGDLHEQTSLSFPESDEGMVIPHSHSISQNPVVRTAIAGAIASSFDAAMTHPFLVLKIRYQDPEIPKALKWTWDPRILTRGLGGNMLSMVPNTMIQFSADQALKMIFHEEGEVISSYNSLLYSSIAGSLTAAISTPVEFTIAWQKQGTGFSATANHLWKMHGRKVFTTGLIGTASREAIYASGYLWGAPRAQKWLAPYLPDTGAGIMGAFFAGVVSGLLSQPVDTLKTRQQKSVNEAVLPMWKLARKMVAEDGVRSLMEGAGPRTASIAFGTTVLYMLGEEVKKRLSN